MPGALLPSFLFEGPYDIPVNRLLRGGEPELSVDDLRRLIAAARDQAQSGGRRPNVASLGEDVVADVHARHGPAGLFDLFLLAHANTAEEFTHVYDVLADLVRIRRASGVEPRPRPLVRQDDELPRGADVERFAWNVLMPSFARKVFHPGRHEGFVVYGVGGPRILVSHPFRGRRGDLYDVYGNSVDVVTSLLTRGFDGSFLFLDYLAGLDREVHGHPAWLLWFSRIAAHADLVLFVGDERQGLGPAQRSEAAFTPAWIPRHVVLLPSDELRWAKVADEVGDAPTIHIAPGVGIVSAEEYERLSAAVPLGFVESYARGAIPADRLVFCKEGGGVAEHALDPGVFGPYEPSPGCSAADTAEPEPASPRAEGEGSWIGRAAAALGALFGGGRSR